MFGGFVVSMFLECRCFGVTMVWSVDIDVLLCRCSVVSMFMLCCVMLCSVLRCSDVVFLCAMSTFLCAKLILLCAMSILFDDDVASCCCFGV